MQEMIEKGGSAVLLNEKVHDLQVLLNADSKTTDERALRTMTQHYMEISKSMRSQKLCKIREMFLDSWFQFQMVRILSSLLNSVVGFLILTVVFV